MRYTIQTSAAGIFPSGENDAVMLTNVGPVTIYLDNNSAVNDQSYPLRPTASIPWDAERPLFAVVRSYPDTTGLISDQKVAPQGILEVTRNSSLADKTLPARILVAERQYTMSNTGADMSGDMGIGFLEVSSFERLTLEYQISSNGFGVNPAIDKFYTWNFFWYDESFRETRRDSYLTTWRIDDFATVPSVLTITPRGQYLVLVLICQGTNVGTDVTGRQFTLRITGNETDDLGNYPWPSGAGSYVGAGTYQESKNVIAVSDFTTAATELIFLNTARRLRIFWRGTTNVTTAGVLLIRSIRQGVPAPEYGAIEIPTGASPDRISLTIDTPDSDGIFLDLNGVVLAGAGRHLLTAVEYTD